MQLFHLLKQLSIIKVLYKLLLNLLTLLIILIQLDLSQTRQIIHVIMHIILLLLSIITLYTIITIIIYLFILFTFTTTIQNLIYINLFHILQSFHLIHFYVYEMIIFLQYLMNIQYKAFIVLYILILFYRRGRVLGFR